MAFGAVAEHGQAFAGGLGPGQDVPEALGLARAHGQGRVHGVQEVQQGVAADVAEHGLQLALLAHLAHNLAEKTIRATRADHRRTRQAGHPGLGGGGSQSQTRGDQGRRPFGDRLVLPFAGHGQPFGLDAFLDEAVSVLDDIDRAGNAFAEAADQLHGQGIGEAQGQNINFQAQCRADLFDKQSVRAVGDDAYLSVTLGPGVERAVLDHGAQGRDAGRTDLIVKHPRPHGQGDEIAHLGWQRSLLSRARFHQPDQALTVTKHAAGDDCHRRVELPPKIRRDASRFVHLLMIARLEDRNAATFEHVARVDQVLGGAGGVVAGDIIDEAATLAGVKGGAGDHVGGLEKARNLHGHDAVAACQGVPEADSRSHGLVHGPAHGDHVLDLRQPLVDDLGAGRARISVSGMDPGPYAAYRKGHVALNDHTFACLTGAQRLHCAHESPKICHENSPARGMAINSLPTFGANSQDGITCPDLVRTPSSGGTRSPVLSQVPRGARPSPSLAKARNGCLHQAQRPK